MTVILLMNDEVRNGGGGRNLLLPFDPFYPRGKREFFFLKSTR